MIVDLNRALRVVNPEVAYWGVALVGDVPVSIDGRTNRDRGGWTWPVLEEICRQFSLECPSDRVWDGWVLYMRAEMSFGEKYVVMIDGESMMIELIVCDEPTIWRVHAEKIAEDVSDELLKRWHLSGQLKPGQSLRDWMIELIVVKISETLPLREDL